MNEAALFAFVDEPRTSFIVLVLVDCDCENDVAVGWFCRIVPLSMSERFATLFSLNY